MSSPVGRYYEDIEEHLKEALGEWQEELKDFRINIDIIRANTEEEANLVISEYDEQDRVKCFLKGTTTIGLFAETRPKGLPTAKLGGVRAATSGVIALNSVSHLFLNVVEFYKVTKSLFESPEKFIEFFWRGVFKHEIGHAFGLMHPLRIGENPYAEGGTFLPTPVLAFPEGHVPDRPFIMEKNPMTYIRALYERLNRNNTGPVPYLLNANHLAIAPYESAAIAYAVNLETEWQRAAMEECTSALYNSSFPTTKRSANVSMIRNRAASYPGAFHNIVPGDAIKVRSERTDHRRNSLSGTWSYPSHSQHSNSKVHPSPSNRYKRYGPL